MNRRAVLLGVVLALAAAAPAAAQGRIVMGRVVEGMSQTGVADAVVSLSSEGVKQRSLLTDHEGNFVFFDVADGTYGLGATKIGYWDGAFEKLRPRDRGKPFIVGPGKQVVGLAVPIWKAPTVSGRVSDEHGEPAAGWSVRVLAPLTQAGERRWRLEGQQATTDDRGMYTIGGMDEGDYLIMVVPPARAIEDEGGRTTYPVLLYPGTARVSAATVITLAYGDTRTGVDFKASLVEARRIVGVVKGAERLGDITVEVALWDPATEVAVTLATTQTDSKGGFVFPALPPGMYQLASAPPEVEQFQFGTNGVTVEWLMSTGLMNPAVATIVDIGSRDLDDATIVLPGMAQLVGRLVFDRATKPLAPALVRVYHVPVSSPDAQAMHFAKLDDQLGFRADVPAGLWVVGVPHLPEGWMVASVTSGGRSIVDVPIRVESSIPTEVEITLTDRVTELAGTVREADGGPLGERTSASVLVFGTDQNTWSRFGRSPVRMKSTRVAADGAFRVRALPAGEYFVIAVDDAVAADWKETGKLTMLSKLAMRVRIAADRAATVDLRITTVR